ncbi:MAG: hypothetical protein AABX82_06775 [Nanoarchaeota archaeon]
MEGKSKELRKLLSKIENEKFKLPEKYIHPDSKEIFSNVSIFWMIKDVNKKLTKHSAIHLILDFELNFFMHVNDLLKKKYLIKEIDFKTLLTERNKAYEALEGIDKYYLEWFNYFLIQLDTCLENLNIINEKERLIKLATLCNNKIKIVQRAIKNNKEPKLWIYDILEEFILELKNQDFLPMFIIQAHEIISNTQEGYTKKIIRPDRVETIVSFTSISRTNEDFINYLSHSPEGNTFPLGITDIPTKGKTNLKIGDVSASK